MQLRHSLGCLMVIVTSAELSDEAPSKRMDYCLFGHESPEGRLSLYLFGGTRITAGTRTVYVAAFKPPRPLYSAMNTPYREAGLL